MSIFYTSDIHFGHKSLMANGRFQERPFETVEEHDAEIIKRWNAKVTNADHVYILGDIGMKNMHPELIAQLKGNKHLILGNHDNVRDLRVRQLFASVTGYDEITDSGRRVILSHYPIMMWNGMARNNIHLYGHLHNTMDEKYYQEYLADYKKKMGYNCKAYNVGVCNWDYAPVTLDEILKAEPGHVKVRGYNREREERKNA